MTKPTVFAVTLLVTAGCYRPCREKPIPLLGGILSQQTQVEVRRALQGGQAWVVEKEEKGPTDGRPRFDFVLIKAGRMTDLGHTGNVQFWFYNDRLMSVSFTPEDAAAYFSLVRGSSGAELLEHEIVALPTGARVWRVGASQDGPIIEWFDPCLREENNSWIMQYAKRDVRLPNNALQLTKPAQAMELRS